MFCKYRDYILFVVVAMAHDIVPILEDLSGKATKELHCKGSDQYELTLESIEE
jgi:hypothetical protein